jgi:hypothetical protein
MIIREDGGNKLTRHCKTFVSKGPIGSSGVSVNLVWAGSVTIGIFWTIYIYLNQHSNLQKKKKQTNFPAEISCDVCIPIQKEKGRNKQIGIDDDYIRWYEPITHIRISFTTNQLKRQFNRKKMIE